MSLNNIRQKIKKATNQQPSAPALQQRHSNTRFPPPPPSQIATKTNSSPTRRRIPDERAVPFTQCPSPINHNSSSRLRLSTIISSGTAVEGASPSTQSASPLTTRSNPGVQQQSVTSRPPLPPNKKSSASAAFAWATSTTPRMRVPLTNQSSGASSSAVVGKRSSIEELADKFHYKGPHQLYPGPPTTTCTSLATDGSEPLKWFPFRNSTHLLKPPPPPSVIVEDIQGHQSDPQPQPPNQQQSSNPSGMTPQQLSAEQHTFLKNLLQTARRLAPPLAQPSESDQATPLLTTSISGEPGLASSSPSFPSNSTLNQLEQVTLQQNPLQRTPSVGPFINNGIPNEIQDDLLRIELLLGLGLEKYKEAINQKIQNHNQIIQLVKSRSSQLNAQQSQSQQKFLTKYPHPPYPYPHYPLQPQQQVYPAIMDMQQSNTNNVDGGDELSIPNVAKPVWSNHHTAEPFNTPNFTLNTFMEPHPEASTKGDQNANDQNPISLLKPINFDDFQALAEQSRSGFQSNEGMQLQQNPLIAGALQYQLSPLPYHFNQIHPQCPDLNLLEPEVTKAVPLVIQVAPRKESTPTPQPQEQQQPELPRKQSTVQQQYQEYLQQDENNMKDLSPNSFKILEQPVDFMPRKPVAVAKGLPRSPSNLFPTEGLTIVKANDKPNNIAKPNSTAVSPPPVARGGTKKINLDKPSPFFPGFSEKPIQMKIKSPRTRTGGSSTGGQTMTSVTSGGAGSSKLEGVEELGNLLSRLPVLSRKQKVEEFQAFSTIKPETPLTEGDSETSMIPLVSSNGTLISDRRPDSGQRERRRVGATSGGGTGSMKVEVSEAVTTDEEFTNLDTNKMSINELVTLGRKIYRILSQLSTNSNGQTTPPTTTPQNEPQQEHRQPNQVYTAPVTLNVPTPNTPVFTPKAKSIKTRGSANKAQGLPVSPALIVDFNSMPNPTFITGPGVNAGKNTPKLVPSSKLLGGNRTPSQQQLPPNLFRNIVKPPPTRWGDNGKRSASSAKKKPTKGRKISRRSTSSMMSATRAGRAGTPGGKLKKSRTPSYPNQQPEEVPIPKTLPTSFTVRENYNNNYTRKSSARYKRRAPTPYPYPSPMDDPNPSGMTINSTAGSGISRSLGRRNFIQENINKAAMMRKRTDSRVGPRKLPPVENYYKKIYESVPSRIPGSRSRSNSMSIHRLHHHPRREKHQNPNQPDYLPPPPHDLMMRRANEHSTRRVGSRGGYDNRYQRSSSVPATSHTAYSNSPYPSHYQQQRSLSTPRPSTGMSVNLASSSNRSESSLPQNNQNQNPNQASRPSSQGILKSSISTNAKPVKTKNGASKVKFEKLPSKSSITDDNVAPAPPPEEVSQMARKSRSKTKRAPNLVEKKAPILNNPNQNSNNKASSASSTETQTQETPPAPPPPPPKKKILRMKPKPIAKNRKQVTIAENVSTDYSDNNEQKGALKKPVFNSESDQKIIRNVVKEEIKLMVNRKAKKSINKLKHRSTSSKKGSGGRGEEDFIKRRIDLDEEVDEGGDTDGGPPFQSGLRHRPVNSPVEREDIDSGDITPVYTPPKFYDESLFSLEKWVNPDTVPPGSAYTSENDTPANIASNKDDHFNSVFGVVGGRVRNGKLGNSSNAKPGVVRFSLPTVTNQMKIKTKKSK